MHFITKFGNENFSCSRAWLPPSGLWVFAPRNDHYCSGGWYIERRKKWRHPKDSKQSYNLDAHNEAHNMEEMNNERNLKISTILQDDPASTGLPAYVPILTCSFESLENIFKRSAVNSSYSQMKVLETSISKILKKIL